MGAGPAGRALTHRLAQRNVAVTLVDSHPQRMWRATYACWTDELPAWVPSDVVAQQLDAVRICCPHPRDIPRSYAVLDTAALRQALTDPQVEIVAGRAVVLGDNAIRVDDGTVLRAGTVIDARGTAGHGPRQTAWGIVVPRPVAAPILDGADAILMDWRPAAPELTGSPSFLYAVPLDAERVLLEETCLAGAPALSPSALRDRLTRRLACAAIDPDDVLASERVSFGLTGIDARPWRHRPLLYGARAGLMHPATGYSVAASLAAADDVAAAVSSGRQPAAALWPRPARAIARLRSVGLRALLEMDTAEIADFFDNFFSLPVAVQRDYLSERRHLGSVLAAMVRIYRGGDRRQRLALMRALI
ncbi:lycopene cyclase family protein [Gordonia sp. DT30]|uniref:lycopene cyclase family protein n=1 Tax=Gordonia sp. DT30 TaxID=3416546 RepID=UPI003CF6385F